MSEILGSFNILTSEEANNLFDDVPEEVKEIPTEVESSTDVEEGTDPDKDIQETIETGGDSIFDLSESVDSEENSNEGEDSNPKEDKNSPDNFYSSIANALKDDGVLSNLHEDDLKGIKDDLTFKVAIEKYLTQSLTERQARVEDALNNGVEVDVIKQYENTLTYLDNVTEEALSDESNLGNNLRRQLIYQDLINRNFSEERALRELEKSFAAGTDIEDAKDALSGNRNFYKQSYNSLVREKENENKINVQKQQEYAEKVKKDILESSNVFEGFDVDKEMRNRIYESVASPIHKGPNGQSMTPIQKYEMENREDFIKKIGFLFVATDGFKSLDKLVLPRANSKYKSSLKNLESTINNTRRTSSGDVNFVTSVSDDPNSLISAGWTLDV